MKDIEIEIDGDKIKKFARTIEGETIPDEEFSDLLRVVNDLHKKHGFSATNEALARALVSYILVVMNSTTSTIENENFKVTVEIKNE